MTAIDSLMLDAKQAILEEHHRRFQSLYQEGRREEALQQIHVTLSCAADLLNESLRILDEVLDRATPHTSDGSTSPSTEFGLKNLAIREPRPFPPTSFCKILRHNVLPV